MASRQVLWLNEVNYFGVGGDEFIEIAVPVDHGLRPSFKVALYDHTGALISVIDQPGGSPSGVGASGLLYVKIPVVDLPNTGFGVALIRDDGSVAEFLSFAGAGAITASGGPAAGATSTFIAVADTNSTRTIGLTGTAAGPNGGWAWAANVATVPAAGRNPGQTHTPTSTANGTGDGNANTLVGVGSANTLNGLGGADLLLGLGGIDTLNGGAGDDVLIGGTGADALDGGADFDIASYNTAVAGVTVNLGSGVHTGEAAGDTFVSIEKYELTAFADTFTGAASGEVIDAAGGNDTITGGSGDDTIDGGAGVDTVHFSGNIDDYDGGPGSLIVTDTNPGDGDNGVDTLTNVEILQFADQRVLIVGNGSEYATIQAAVNAAQDGDTILIVGGTYAEQVVIDGFTDLTISALDGTSVTIVAPANVSQTVLSSTGRALNAVVTVIDSTNVFIDGITIDGAGHGDTVDGPNANFVGVLYRNSSGGLENVDITGVRDPYAGGTTMGGHQVVSGVQRGVGLQVDNDTILDFAMSGGSISDFQKNASVFNRANLDVSGVTITGGGAQTINAQNGIQALNSTGSITNNVVTGIGYAGPADAYSGGILLYDNGALSVTGNQITGSNGEALAAKVVGIFVFNNTSDNLGATITGNTINHTDIGIGIYDDNNGTVLVGPNTITNIDTTDAYAVGVDLQPTSGGPYYAGGTPFADILVGAENADILLAGPGDDYLEGNGGNDQLFGGPNTDTAHYDGVAAGYQVGGSVNGQGFVTAFTSVTDTNAGNGDEGADALTAVEILEFADATLNLADPVQLFDGGGAIIGTFTSIQAAITAASNGQTIRIAAGTYNENVTINKSLTLLGMGDGDDVVIQGTFETDNAIVGDVHQFLFSTASYSGAAGTGIAVSADNVTIANLVVDGFTSAIAVAGASVSDLTLNDVIMQDSVNGFRKGNSTALDGLTINGGAIQDSAIGIYLAAEDFATAQDATDVTIDGTLFEDLAQKGIYAETLQGVTLFDNLEMNNVGQLGRGPAFGAPLGGFGNGIDINLKFHTYVGSVTIEDFVFTDVGASNGAAATGHFGGAAIAIKGRDDPAHLLYGAHPADVDSLSVTIRNGTIDGTSTGVRVGEPGKANEGLNVSGPAVTIENVQITDNLANAKHDQIDNRSHSTLTVIGTGGDDTFHAASAVGTPPTNPTSTGPIAFDGGAGADNFRGAQGDDTLNGGADNDTLDGGAGFDTALFGVLPTSADVAWNGSAWIVSTPDGVDTIVNVEILNCAAPGKILLVGGGSAYATIQSAVNAAASGDTILLAAGTYTEDVTIAGGLAITIEGKGSVALNGQITASGELNGTLTLRNLDIDAIGKSYGVFSSNSSSAFAGAIVLDDVSIENAAHSGVAYIRAGNGSAPALTDTIGDIQILGGAFDNNGNTPAAGNGRGHVLLFGYNQDLTIDGASFNGTANTQKAIQLRGLQDGGDVAGAGPYDQGGNVTLSDLMLTGSHLQDAIALYNIAAFDSFSMTNVVANVSAPWGVFNADGVGGVLDASGLSGTNSGGPGLIATLQGLGTNDTLTGTAGSDVLTGRGGGDTLAGGDGDDLYNVDSGDTIVETPGGGGADHARSFESFTLDDNVENLTLLDPVTRNESFENFALGPIANGENGWTFGGGSVDQEIVSDGGDKKLRISSDPTSGSFVGPYSPGLSRTAGEASTTADYDAMQITFNFKAVSPGDNSRMEVDFGVETGADRNNFMVIENTGAGIRIAVADPLLDGNWDTGEDLNDFAAFTGNRTLVQGLDASLEYNLTMVVRFVDGADNDVIDFFVNGAFIGSSTTFENYRDALGGAHGDNAEANQVNRLFFRSSAGGAPQDGPGGQNQGFLFDDVQYSVFDAAGPSGTGNASNNIINGNSANNALSGLGGADTLNGGLGSDSLTGGEGADAIDGGAGFDTVYFSGNADDYAVLFGVATSVTDLNAGDGDDGADTLANVEALQFADARVLLVGNGSAYSTIQAAVNAAVNGDTILVAAGVYAENITIPNGLAITIDGAGAVTIVGQVTASGDLNGALTLRGLDIDATGKEYGLLSNNTSTGYAGAIVLDDVSIENANHAGFLYVLPGNLSTPTQTNTVGDIQIIDSDFANNGLSIPSGEGRAHVSLFGYNQDLSVTESSFAGAANTQKAVQLRGLQSPGDVAGVGPYQQGGDVSFTDVSIAGSYLKDALAIYNFAAFDSFTLSGVVANTNAAWGVFNADGVGGALDISGLSGTNAGAGGLLGALQGLSGGEAYAGTGGRDFMRGRNGGDSFEGDGGNDTIWGELGSDTAIYSGDRADYTITFASGAFTIHDDRVGSPDGEDTVTGVEFFQFADATYAAGALGANEAPTDILLSGGSVTEGNAGNVTIGTLSAADPNPTDTFTYTFATGTGDVNNGSFSIVGDQLVFTGAADFEAQSSYSVRVRVTDQGGLFYEEAQTIAVNDVSEVPGAADSSTILWLNEVSYFNTNAATNPDFLEVAIPIENSHKPLFQIAIYDRFGNLLDTIDSPAGTSANGIQYLRFEHFETPGGGLPDDGFAVALIRSDGSLREFLSFGLGAATVTATDGPASGSVSAAVTAIDNNNRSVGLTGSASGPDGWNWTSNVALALTGRNPLQNHTPITTNPVTGTAGDNRMIGTTAANTLNGSGGNDALFGLAGNDTLNGDTGNDTLVGGAGADVLDGGADTDTASYISSNIGLTINMQTGVHTGNAAGDTFISIESIRLSEFNDVFRSSNTTALSGTVNGGLGDDIYHAGTAGIGRFSGAEGNDTFNGSSAVSVFTGGEGNDTANGGSGNETLSGNNGDDTLSGGGGVDTINGGAGLDTLIGGTQNDSLNGGGADGVKDTFVYNFGVNTGLNEGADTIAAFEDDVDQISVYNGATYTLTNVGPNVQIALSTGSVITVLNMNDADIADDIIMF